MVCLICFWFKLRKKFNRKVLGILFVECLWSNFLYGEVGVEYCVCVKVLD